MQKTPTSIGIISGWLIFSAVVSLVVNLLARTDPEVLEVMTRNPIPITIQIVWVYAGTLVSFASGIGIIKRQDWARFLYVIWSGTSLLLSFLTSPVKIASVPGLIIWAVIFFFLFSPNAKLYFTGRRSNAGISNDRQKPEVESGWNYNDVRSGIYDARYAKKRRRDPASG